VIKNAALILLLFLLTTSTIYAEDLDARSYTNIPIGQNFFGLAYAYTDGDIYTDADIPYQDVNIQINGPLVAYAHTFSLFGQSAKVDMITGHFCADADALANGERISRSFCGMADTKIRLNYNFYGAPALTLKDYVKQKKEMVIGASIQLSLPTGDYDKQYILNVGANRWFIKPEIGLSIPFGNWEFDSSFGVKFFTDNDELQKTKTFEQDPIYNLQFHLVYHLAPGRWIALNSNYFDGGDTYVNGQKSGIKKANNRAGITYSMAITRFQSIKLFANTGVTTRLGNDSDAIGIAWTYRWE
jgi:hypothetical protein